MLARLRFVYGPSVAPSIMSDIERLVSSYAGTIKPRPCGWSPRDALLISYADSILGPGCPIGTLHQFLRSHVGDLISYVHLLPFYPFSSDDGFAVEDFRAVRPGLGAWNDIELFGDDYRLVFDGVINHVSSSSLYMKGYCSGDPRYAGFFIELDPATDTSSVLRTRNLPLLHEYDTASGKRWLWTTFSRDQVDLNFANPLVLLEIIDVMLFYARKGASMVRLDAIPYMWKQLGTSCAHLPQTHELIKLLRDVYDAAAPHVDLLTETNVPHRENVAYFGNRGDEAQMIYNFTLAPLVLWSFHRENASVLSDWARGIEVIGSRATYLNITATHDGIGMRPTEGILSEQERMELVQLARDHGGDMTGKRNSDGSVSPYELNLNYFDAINDPRSNDPDEVMVRRFLASQAIPMSLAGMPGIYIHSLLGSRNDHEGVKRTGRARSINRQQLQIDDLERALCGNSIRALVFEGMKEMLRIRRGIAAFSPDAPQEIPDFGKDVFAVLRTSRDGRRRVLALVNVTGRGMVMSLPPAMGRNWRDLLSRGQTGINEVPIGPYGVRWLELS